MKHHHKFLIGVKTSLKLVSSHLNEDRNDFITRGNYNSSLHLYIRSYTESWDYTEEKPRKGETVSDKRRAEWDYGYFALMSNGIKNPVKALKIYRMRDLIEKSFGNLKDRLSMRRMSVSSGENFEGKLFVQFVALETMSYIKKKMADNDLYRIYTMQVLLDEIDTIGYYQQPGRAHHLSEVTEKQRGLYGCMDVEGPT